MFHYEDLSDKDVRSKVLNDTRGLNGVYLIYNKVTKKYYIGSSAGSLYSGFLRHLIYLIGSVLVKHAVTKYGISSFAFLILEIFPEKVTLENKKEFLSLEDNYLKSLKPEYNIFTQANSRVGYKHSEATKKKLKDNYSEERKQKIGDLNRGKNLSASTIEALRKSALAREKRVFTEEATRNMKKASKAIQVFNLDGSLYAEFPSIQDALKPLG